MIQTRYRYGLMPAVYLLVVLVLFFTGANGAVYPFARESRTSAFGSCGGNSTNDADSSFSFEPFISNVFAGAGCEVGSSGGDASQDSELLLADGQLTGISISGSCFGTATGSNVTEESILGGGNSWFEFVFSVDSDSVLFSAIVSLETSGIDGLNAWGTAQGKFFMEDLSKSEYLVDTIVYSDEELPTYYEELEFRLGPGDYRIKVEIICNAITDTYIISGGASALAGYDIQVEFKPDRKIRILDRLSNPLSNTDLILAHSAYDIPDFTESDIVEVTTNDSGEFILPPDFEAGDTIKVSKTLHIEPAKKHLDALGTVYSISLDNGKFDAIGQMSYYELTDSAIQQISLGHTTIHWNLLVSIEWDAHLPYIQHTEEGFRRMANYLFDVTDGQVVLDTIMIYDNRQYWAQADIRVHSSNMEWPRATTKGWWWPNYADGSATTMWLPRQWFGSSDKTRNLTFTNDPLDVSVPLDYRTRAHELGHYLFGFRDEYAFVPTGASKCDNNIQYGYMESQYITIPPQPMTSEMSNSTPYSSLPCQNTRQWDTHKMSCWNLVQNDYEKRWGLDSIFAPIDLPGESELIDPNTYFIGPNDDLENLDYNVGARVVFPVVHSASAANTLTLGVINEKTLEHVGNTNVTVLRVLALPPFFLNQGNTNDSGFIKLLGINQTDIIYGNGYYTYLTNKSGMRLPSAERGWLFGEATIGSPGRSKLGNSSFLSADDGLTLALIPVVGNYQFIPSLTIAATDTKLELESDATFIELPDLQQIPDSGTIQPHIFTAVSAGYTSEWSETLSGSGVMRIWGTDDSSRSFFVDCPYSVETTHEGDSTFDFFAADGSAILSLIKQDTTTTQVSIMSSHYPVLRHGLSEDNLQAGAALSISLFRAQGVIGSSSLTIRYADSELGDEVAAALMEPSLRIFKWNSSLWRWLEIVSSVDTSANEVVAEITADGEYAAFSTNIATDVEEIPQGTILPFHFELSQNYPNPFNPMTTIAYSLSERSHVVIDVFNMLGQQVYSLVNREEAAGSYTITWDGRTSTGSPAASGVYLYRFQTGDYVQTKKMLLLK